jgi:hypothetical protein
MRKRLIILPVSGLLVAVLLILMLFPLTVSATQTADALISGVVTLNGQSLNPEDVATVTAMIEGVSLEWSKDVTYIPGVSRYVQLKIPADTGGSGPKNGGKNYDIIHFKLIVNGVTYLDNDTVKWFTAMQLWHPINIGSPEISNLQITTSALKDAQVGISYSQAVNATGGTLPYTWSWESNDANGLPPGLDISPTSGTIAGTPTMNGEYAVKVKVQDDMQINASRDFVLSVANVPDGLTITTQELPRWPVEVFTDNPGNWVIPPPGWIAGQAYTAELTATGGLTPYQWSASNLPPGLGISGNGTVSGIPTVPGVYVISFAVTDSNNPAHSNSQQLTLKIYKKADANGNGTVTPGDVGYCEQVILKNRPPTAGCDANLDKVIDVADITQIEWEILNQ